MTPEPTPLRAIIRVLWDQDASVWVATSDDVQGLVVEAASFDEVVQEVRMLAPELLQLNGASQARVLDLHFLADRLESVAAIRSARRVHSPSNAPSRHKRKLGRFCALH